MRANFFTDASGATFVEYALMLGLIALVIIVSAGYLGLALADAFNRVNRGMP
jgi:Flp pilus assembly pilin Flp